MREPFEASFVSLSRDKDALLVSAEIDGETIAGYLLAHCPGTFPANGPVARVEEVTVEEVTLASRRAGAFYRALRYQDSATFFKKTLIKGGT